MPVFKYRTFEEAEKSLWQFKKDDAYYEKLYMLFDFFGKLNPPAYPAGIFKHPNVDSANRQKVEWDIRIGLKKYKALCVQENEE
jgi:hypothetical protein